MMVSARCTLIVFAVLLASPPFALAQDETVKIGGRDVAIWKPKGGSSGRQPVLIFSHGFGGCATQSRFLTEALAAHGYWVFAPNHNEARCQARGAGPSRPDAPFREPERWSDKSYRDRADDIRAIIKMLRDSTRFSSRVDLDRLGLLGHSLGGYTVVGLAGGWASWKLPGVKAVLALSPYTDPFLVHRTLSGVSTPIRYQGGTLDLGITPSLKKSSGVYDETPAPKYFVEFAGAGHFAWTNLRSSTHKLILDYSLPFLDRYVRGQTAGGEDLTKMRDGVSQLRYHSELGESDQRAPAQPRGRSRAGIGRPLRTDFDGDSRPFGVSRLPGHVSLENAPSHRAHSAR
jgi:predicted dienelactone hydrolase